jgi:hypothetical protein
MFGRRVLSKIFRPKREQVKGDQRKTHNDELFEFYSLQNVIQVNK